MRSQQSIYQGEMRDRIEKQFIGLGHELEDWKRKRKVISKEEKTINNRVQFLRKQEERARKNLSNQKKKLNFMKDIQVRYKNDKIQKSRLQQQKLNQLQKLRRNHQQVRKMRQTSILMAREQLKNKNKSDHDCIKRLSAEADDRRKQNKKREAEQKNDIWKMLNFEKERGKIKVDTFYRTRNKEFVSDYYKRILNQQNRSRIQLQAIYQLENKQKELSFRLTNTNFKINQISSAIDNISPSRIKPIRGDQRRKNKQSNKIQNEESFDETISKEDIHNHTYDGEFETKFIDA